jgi:hypothetical protein
MKLAVVNVDERELEVNQRMYSDGGWRFPQRDGALIRTQAEEGAGKGRRVDHGMRIANRPRWSLFCVGGLDAMGYGRDYCCHRLARVFQ